jgi:aspartate/methionine/tyrosine aminotransferase
MPTTTSPVAAIPRSGIRTLMELALRDPQAIRLEVGEPDQTTPAHVIDAAAADSHAGHTGYSSSTGLSELREALAARVSATTGRATSADEVVVTHGAMHGLTMAMQAVLAPGQQVLLPDPEFPNWRMAAVSTGIEVGTYPARAENGFVPDPADVERAVTDRTRAIVVCSPNNPTGAVYPRGVLEGIVDVARRHDLWVLSDECYEEFTFDAPHVGMTGLDPDGRVLSFFSFSKTHAMTGWRVGYVVVPDPTIQDMLGQIAEATISCPSTIGQRAALAALTGPQDHVAAARDAYRARRDAAVSLLAARGIGCVRPAGAFYLMVDVSAATTDSDAFARRLLAERHVAVAPGSTFGAAAEGFVRISLAAGEAAVLEGLERLADMVHTWHDEAGAPLETAGAHAGGVATPSAAR